MHVTIDGFGGDPKQLGDLELVRNLLDRYPKKWDDQDLGAKRL